MDVTSQAIKDYTGFLINHSLNPLPAGKIVPGEFSSKFFSNTAEAVSALEKVLANVKSKGAALSDDVYAEFALTGHGETDSNTLVELTGQSGGMLNAQGREFALDQREELKGKKPDVVVSSDLPRAIHHALIKFATLSEEEQISLEAVGKHIDANKKPDEADYYNLVDLALKHGIIPTPLARAQYYSMLELQPEKFELKDKSNNKYKDKSLDKLATKFAELKKSDNLVEPKPAVFEFLTTFLSEKADKVRMRELYELLLKRKHATEYRQSKDLPKDEKLSTSEAAENQHSKYLPIDENRLLFYYRVDALMSIFKNMGDGLRGSQVEIVAHSGFVDVALWYFRNKLKNEDFHLESRPKGESRGETVSVKVDDGFKYLNDPSPLKKIRDDSEKACIRQREASLDEGIRKKGNSIIPVELLGFKKEKDGHYKSHKVSLDDVLNSDKPALLLGNFGQGRSTAAVELTEKLNSDDKYKNKYFAVFLTARDINHGLLNKLGNDSAKNDSEVKKLLSQGVPELPLALRKEYAPVFIIDALDELSSDIRDGVIYGLSALLPKSGKVIATSRFTEFDTYENEDKGFNTFHLDPNAVTRNLDAYLAGRIVDEQGKPDLQRFEKFKEFLMRQDDGVKTNYLLVHFLSNLYNKTPSELGDLNKPLSEGEILIKGIRHALWEHKVPRGAAPKEPSPHGEQSESEVAERKKKYEKDRKDSLDYWMGFLQRAAAYMTINNTRAIDMKGLEEVFNPDWTISKYLSKLKR